MVRKHRVWFPNAMYHVTNRGVRKMTIFYDEQDYLKYLELLEKTKECYPFHLHSYCLMTNHVHLLIQTINDPISTIMKKLNINYAKYFNKRHDLVGHIFQSRFGAELIDSIQYKLDASKYIHLNPVDAKMVEKAEDYKWSSYESFISTVQNPLIYKESILSHFPPPAKDSYRKFVEQPDKLSEPPERIKPFVKHY